MSEELCNQCPYKDEEKALLPCNACLGNIPYGKIWDEMFILLERFYAIHLNGKNREKVIKRELKRFYVKAQTREFERSIKDQITKHYNDKKYNEQFPGEINPESAYCKHCRQLTTGMEVLEKNEVQKACSNCGTIYGQEGP